MARVEINILNQTTFCYRPRAMSEPAPRLLRIHHIKPRSSVIREHQRHNAAQVQETLPSSRDWNATSRTGPLHYAFRCGLFKFFILETTSIIYPPGPFPLETCLQIMVSSFLFSEKRIWWEIEKIVTLRSFFRKKCALHLRAGKVRPARLARAGSMKG